MTNPIAEILPDKNSCEKIQAVVGSQSRSAMVADLETMESLLKGVATQVRKIKRQLKIE